MHVFFPMVGRTARVSPIEQHISRAAVQFALEIYIFIYVLLKLNIEQFLNLFC